MDWFNDYYFNNDKALFRRVVDVTYRVFKLEDVDLLALQNGAPRNFVEGSVFTSSPILLKESGSPKGEYNLVHFEDRFYAVPQALGAVDWNSGKVGAMRGVVVAATPEEVMAKVSELKPAQ